MKLRRAIKQLKKFLAEDEDLHLVGHDNTAGIDIHFAISSIKRENNAVVLRGTNKSSQHLCLVRKIKAILVENWDCPYIKEIHRLKICKFLKEGRLGSGDEYSLPRGFSPANIRKAIGGSEEQIRECLSVLEASGKVIFTGAAKGKRYCHIDYKQQAEENFQKEQQMRAKAYEERKNRLQLESQT